MKNEDIIDGMIAGMPVFVPNGWGELKRRWLKKEKIKTNGHDFFEIFNNGVFETFKKDIPLEKGEEIIEVWVVR